MEIDDIFKRVFKGRRALALEQIYRAVKDFIHETNLPFNVLKVWVLSYEINEDKNTIVFGIKAHFSELPPIEVLKQDLNFHIDKYSTLIL